MGDPRPLNIYPTHRSKIQTTNSQYEHLIMNKQCYITNSLSKSRLEWKL